MKTMLELELKEKFQELEIGQSITKSLDGNIGNKRFYKAAVTINQEIEKEIMELVVPLQKLVSASCGVGEWYNLSLSDIRNLADCGETVITYPSSIRKGELRQATLYCNGEIKTINKGAY